MYFIIDCETDGSFCFVEEKAVIYDAESITIGDVVTFVYCNKYYKGTIFMQSDDEDYLHEQLRQLREEVKAIKTSSNVDKKYSKIKLGKRSVKINEKSPPKVENKKKAYKKTRALSKIVPSSSESDCSDVEPTKECTQIMVQEKKSMPITNCKESLNDTKNNLKNKKHLELQGNSVIRQSSSVCSVNNYNENDEIKKLHFKDSESSQVELSDLNANKNEIPHDEEVDILDIEEDPTLFNDENQLFGKDCTDDAMILLKDNIYCKKLILESAFGCSHKASHLVRRILTGVFKHEALMKSTVTGQSPRAQGHERKCAKYEPLNNTAKNAIIDYCIAISFKKKWVPQTRQQLLRVMTQKLGELKKEERTS